MKTDPWKIAILSYIIPGLGQWYLRQRYLSATIFILVMSLISLGVQQIISPNGNTHLGWALVGWSIIIWAIGLAHSIVLAVRLSRSEGQPKEEKHKSPYLAMILSFIISGLGQLYARDIINAVAFFVVVVLGKIVFPKVASLFFIEGLGLLSALLATKKLRPIIKDTGSRVVLIVLLLFGSEALRTATNAIVWSPRFGFLARAGGGDSMNPTLKIGDIMLRDPGLKNQLKRGDIIDLRRHNQILCKRLIAFAGETVAIKKGRVYINGDALHGTPYDSFYYTTDSTDVFDGGKKTYIVPNDCVFVLGDNSMDSEDSRYFGGVKIEAIIGVIYKVIYPFDRIKLLLPYQERLNK